MIINNNNNNKEAIDLRGSEGDWEELEEEDMGGNEGRKGKEEVMQLDFNLEKQNKNLKRYQFCFSFCGALLYRREEQFCFISCANIFFFALYKNIMKH